MYILHTISYELPRAAHVIWVTKLKKIPCQGILK